MLSAPGGQPHRVHMRAVPTCQGARCGELGSRAGANARPLAPTISRITIAAAWPAQSVVEPFPRGTAITAAPGLATDSSSSSVSTWKRTRRRPAFALEPPSINWDRWEMLLYRRAHEAGLLDEEEDEDEDEDEDSSSESLSSRLAAPDLAAAYFRHWDDPAVHQPLMQDRELLSAWKEALSCAPPGALKGATVLEVGCGLGLLSMMAIKAGAARVIAVDGSLGAVEAARKIIRANGLQDNITVVHGSIENLEELPGVTQGSVDVVLSNWMGPGLLGGGMIHSVALAAKRWLRPGGLVLPDKVTLWAAGLEDREALQDAKDSWSRVAGWDLSAALGQVICHPRRDVLTRKGQLMSAPQCLGEWDLAALGPEGVWSWERRSQGQEEDEDEDEGEDEEQELIYRRCPFKFTILRGERLFGLVLYWEALWTYGGALQAEGKLPVRFTTHPLSSVTHYQQLMVDLPRTVRVSADDEVRGELLLRPGTTDPRDLEMEVSLVHGDAAPITAAYRVSHM